MRRRLLVLVGCLAGMLGACGGGGGGGTPKCVPGQSIACVGAGPCDGSQVCMPNGAYAACVCGGSGAAGVSGGGGRGGTTGGSGLFGSAGVIGSGIAGVNGVAGSSATAGRAGTGGAGAGGSSGVAGTVGAGGGAAGTIGAAGAAGNNGSAAGSGGGSAGRGGTTGAGGGAAGAGGGTAGAGGGASVCNPVAQTGCATGQRCTWVVTGASTGHAACLADGTVNVGGACSYGPTGETTGFDNCKKGASCLSGICKTICSTMPDSCPTNFACDPYTGAPFDPDNTMGIGFCDPSCDPVTQARADGSPACGSVNPSAPTLGCYGPVGGGHFVCAPVVAPTKTQGMTVPTPFPNACAPGFMPFPQSSAANAPAICIAFCRPANTSSSIPAGAAGLAGSGYTCPDRGAASPNECRYWWNWFEDYTASNYQLTPYSNTVGFCLNYPSYQYDSNNDRVPDTVYPSCTALSPTAHAYDPTLTDASFWGCLAHP